MNNPPFDFYSGIMKIVRHKKDFDVNLAEKLVNIQNKNKENISFKEIDIKFLENLWRKANRNISFHEMVSFVNTMRTVAEGCFIDLSGQVRNPLVKELFREMIKFDPRFFMAIIKSQKDFGDGIVSVTILTNDLSKLKEKIK